MNSTFRAAVLQMPTLNDVRANKKSIADGIIRAADAGADLLVTPECALSGYLPQQGLDFALLQDAQADLVELSSARGIWLALGTTCRRGDAWRNAALLYSPTGEQRARYDKTHMMPADCSVFEPGDALPVFHEGEWTFGIQICFDMRFPENWRILRRRGAEMVIHLSNASTCAGWKVPVLEGAVRSRAAENGMFVISANDSRTPQMMVSSIIDPHGRDLARAPLNEIALLIAEIDRAEVSDDFLSRRRTDLWDTDKHRPLLLG
jgi:predicted amidohydrolase